MDKGWNQSRLYRAMRVKSSALCVGLDTQPEHLPAEFTKNAEGWLAFNKNVIDATRPYAVAYKPNLAFYEAYGAMGWEVLKETFDYIGPDFFKIADAKRGDIGNTAEAYAKAIFEHLGADAVTLQPYMGTDSIQPFLAYEGKVSIVLGVTSNAGAIDFQQQLMANGNPLFAVVCEKIKALGSPEQLMVVTGATQLSSIAKVRTILPHHTFLVPGIGHQGGDLQQLMKVGLGAPSPGLLINVSRGITHQGPGMTPLQTASMYQKQTASLFENTIR